MLLSALGCSVPATDVPNADGTRKRPASYASPYALRDPGTWVDNGMLRVRATQHGIAWFDVFHPIDRRWYLAKNNMNLVVQVNGEWQNSEIERLFPRVRVIDQDEEQITLRYHYAFPNGARIYTDLFLRRGEPRLRYVVHTDEGSAEIEGFQWHITFGQAEAVASLDWAGRNVVASRLPRPFPGGRLELQYMEWIEHAEELDFRFRGVETEAPDPANPWWMSRVLGLEQHVRWSHSLRPGDRFAFEARDQPWQPDWGVPATRPWIEGLWVVRAGGLLEGDELVYQIEELFSPDARSTAAMQR